MSPEIIIIGLGLFIGTILGITGAGGAILSVPLLMYFLHINITQAAPVALFALSLSASVGTYLGLKAGKVRYKSATLMALFGMCFAPVGVWLSHIISTTLLSILFALTLIYVATKMWHGNNEETINKAPAVCQINPMTSKLFWTAPCTARLGLTGIVAGLLSGLLGVGGGFVIVPSLRKVTNFDTSTIISTSLAVVGLVSLSGFVSYALYTSVEWATALTFGIATLTGLLISKKVLKKISTTTSQRVFAVLATAIALLLAYTAINPLIR